MNAPPLCEPSAAPDEPERTLVRRLDGPQPEHRARSVLSEVLARLGLTDEAFEAELAVNELVTNARQHAPPPYEIRISWTEMRVTIAVVDGGIDHGAVLKLLSRATTGCPSEGESGRGLQMVAGLFGGRCGAGATRMSSGLVPAKQVWIVLPRQRSEVVVR
ncbi:ATP-binding protein [Actinomadura sp. WMMB 499]|uniref:ATP-binding protein n=1 Tax=Actinomadura sp. WMMB 499 TaxID=1219491 RepID=UPI00159E52E4|nr:ATP-binding protein [Actinomadura sp. WMMB 499]